MSITITTNVECGRCHQEAPAHWERHITDAVDDRVLVVDEHENPRTARQCTGSFARL